jgi:hypothetical protein
MNGDALAQALSQIGLEGDVIVEGHLAVLVLHGEAPLANEAVRAAAVALAREHGFTHLALELRDAPGTSATLPGD